MPAYPGYGGYGSGGFGGTTDFFSFIQDWQALGVYDVILPFLLIFVLTFAILENISLFGTNRKNVHVIVAAIIGLLFVRNSFLVYVVQNFLGNLAFLIVVILMVMMLFGIFGFTDWSQGVWKYFGIGIPILAILWSLLRDIQGYGGGLFDWWNALPYQIKSSLLPLLIFIVVIAFAIKESPAVAGAAGAARIGGRRRGP